MKCQISPPATAAIPTLPATTPTVLSERPLFPLDASLDVQLGPVWLGAGQSVSDEETFELPTAYSTAPVINAAPPMPTTIHGAIECDGVCAGSGSGAGEALTVADGIGAAVAEGMALAVAEGAAVADGVALG